MKLFENRRAAAEELAGHLEYLKPQEPVVLAVSPMGAPIADIVAERLEAPCDLLMIEKICSPKPPNQVVGAVDEHGRISVIQGTQRWHHLNSKQPPPARDVFRGLADRAARARATLPELDVRKKVVILVGDGVSSGARMLGAVASVRDRGATKVIVAAPAGCEQGIWQLHDAADTVVIPHRPAKFKGIAEFYGLNETVTEEHLEAFLHRWSTARRERFLGVRCLNARFTSPDGNGLHCELDLPPDMRRGGGPYPAVVFIHGFESDGHSARTVPISRRLAKRGIVGARMDLTGHGRSEGQIDQCTQECMMRDTRCVLENVASLDEIDGTRVGLNGSGTGALVALRTAHTTPELRALVIRGPVSGGEAEAASHVAVPTLLIHAARDTALDDTVKTLDRDLAVEHELLVIPDSSRLFGDPISRELMVNATVAWFADHLLDETEAAMAEAEREASAE